MGALSEVAIYFGDAAEVMSTMSSHSVHLVYMDPPFYTNRSFYANRAFYKAEGDSQVLAYRDEWNSREEEKALDRAHISVCWQCARNVSDPEIDGLYAENVETGEVTESPGYAEELRERIARRDARIAELEAELTKLRSVQYRPRKSKSGS